MVVRCVLDSRIQKYKSYATRTGKKKRTNIVSKVVGPGPLSDLNNENKAVYISGPGLYQLELCSPLGSYLQALIKTGNCRIISFVGF